MPAKIHSVSCADMDTQFHNAFADGAGIAQIASLEPKQADPHVCLRAPVVELRQPLRERLTSVVALIPESSILHPIVAYKLNQDMLDT